MENVRPNRAPQPRLTRYVLVARTVHAMATVFNAELYTVGPDEVVVTFTTDSDAAVTTAVGERSVTTEGRLHHATVQGLEADTTYALRVDGVVPDRLCPAEVTTLALPSGSLRSCFATVNDVHFGEELCGLIGGESEVGPVFTTPAGQLPYPRLMNASVIADIAGGDFDAVLVKGDLTSQGTQQEYEQFLQAYGALGDRMHHVRGNHESYYSDDVANLGPQIVALDGVTNVLLDTAELRRVNGHLGHDQLQWLEAVCAASQQPVLIFGHHQLWDPASDERNENTFGVVPGASEAIIEIIGRHSHVGGYFAGHTHRNRVRRFSGARNVPIVEVASTKEYPGAWAEYRVYDGGYLQIGRRASAPEAMAWAERTRGLYAGLYRDYSLGALSDRCFAHLW